MNALVINRPDATDLDVRSVKPSRTFEICNHLLDDHAALETFYHANGYLFFRNVLDPQSVADARAAMLDIAADHFGLIERGDAEARWTGKTYPPMSEELPVFSGISQKLVNNPANQAVLAKILGEKACVVPIVQYRLYPPNGPITGVHQDGFYSPGVQDYKPLWIPLVPCPQEMGGLTIAIGEHKRGYFHNVGKPTPFPIPDDVIDPDSWATIDYMPGDLLVVHPHSPHCGMPNTSDRIRVTFDVRVQSAANPSAFSATVVSATPTSVTLQAEDTPLGTLTLAVDEQTFIRVRNVGKREDFAGFVDYTTPGMRIVAVRDGDRAVMLRAGSRV